jgi:hypothetical protein
MPCFCVIDNWPLLWKSLSNINLKNEIPYTGIPTLSDEIKDNLEGEITYAELTANIKRMENEKITARSKFIYSI